jgi:hypothetical protein
MKILFRALGLSLLLYQPSRADAQILPNPSFENASPLYWYGIAGGTTGTLSLRVLINSGSPYFIPANIPNGNHVALIDVPAGRTSPFLLQTFRTEGDPDALLTLQLGYTYSVSAYVARTLDSLDVPIATLELHIDDGAGPAMQALVASSSLSLENADSWQIITASFTVTDPGIVGYYLLLSGSNENDNSKMGWDAFSATAVPEPSTWLLVFTGLLLWAIHKKKSQSPYRRVCSQ